LYLRTFWTRLMTVVIDRQCSKKILSLNILTRILPNSFRLSVGERYPTYRRTFWGLKC